MLDLPPNWTKFGPFLQSTIRSTYHPKSVPQLLCNQNFMTLYFSHFDGICREVFVCRASFFCLPNTCLFVIFVTVVKWTNFDRLLDLFGQFIVLHPSSVLDLSLHMNNLVLVSWHLNDSFRSYLDLPLLWSQLVLSSLGFNHKLKWWGLILKVTLQWTFA